MAAANEQKTYYVNGKSIKKSDTYTEIFGDNFDVYLSPLEMAIELLLHHAHEPDWCDADNAKIAEIIYALFRQARSDIYESLDLLSNELGEIKITRLDCSSAIKYGLEGDSLVEVKISKQHH